MNSSGEEFEGERVRTLLITNSLFVKEYDLEVSIAFKEMLLQTIAVRVNTNTKKLKKSCHDAFRKIDLITLPYISGVACAVNKIANWFRKYLYTMLVRQEVEEPIVFSLSYLSYSCI